MALRAKVRYPRVDKKKTSEKIDAEMVRNVNEALRVWVINVTNNVPVLTGASKASFLKLAFIANVGLTIVPRIQSRIPLGIETSIGQLLYERGVRYGWIWQSDLDYIHIVDRHHQFLAVGEEVLRNLRIGNLPEPAYKVSGDQ